MDHEKNEYSKGAVIISIVFSAIVMSYIVYVGITRRISLSGKVRYTIGHTIKLQLTMSGRDVKYTYMVKGIAYEAVATYAYDSQVPGGRYWVRFSEEHPEHSELYQNKPIPDYIVEAPPEGWKRIPSR